MPDKNKKDKYVSKVKQRAIDIFSRISHEGNPHNALKEYVLFTPKDAMVRDAIYTITGIGGPSTSKYNGLMVNGRDLEEKAESSGVSPKGFIRDYLAEINNIKPDIVDAISTGKKVNPSIGKQVDVSNRDYGIETDYINRNFPNETVQFIETEPYGINVPNQNGIQSLGKASGDWEFGQFATSVPFTGINNAGFVPELGVRNDSLFVRGYDVFDFIQEEDSKQGYQKKYLDEKKLNNALIKQMSDNTHPLVIRTPWVHHSDADRVLWNNPYANGAQKLWHQYPQYKKNGGLIEKYKKDKPDIILSIINKIRQSKQTV